MVEIVTGKTQGWKAKVLWEDWSWLIVCLARGFGTGIWERAGIWGMEFNNCFVCLDEWKKLQINGGNKHGIC